jgi:hypothetical protein
MPARQRDCLGANPDGLKLADKQVVLFEPPAPSVQGWMQ